MAKSMCLHFYYSWIFLLIVFNVWAEDSSFIGNAYEPDQAFNDGFTVPFGVPLFGEIVADGYVATNLFIGTPPQTFTLTVDTGSHMTFVPCSDCFDCGVHQHRSFDPTMSKSFHLMKCNYPNCDCDRDRNQCLYDMFYGEQSYSSGVLAEDMIRIGGRSPQRKVVFGCELEEDGAIKTQDADGIMGLSRDPVGIIDQLVAQRVMRDSLSLCFGGMDVGGGFMDLGEAPIPSGMSFSFSNVSRSRYYNVELSAIHVAGEALELDPLVFDQGHGTIVDSGTTFALFPYQAFHLFNHSIVKATSALEIIRDSKDNICFLAPGRNASGLKEIFPEVKLVFKNSQNFTLSPENYLFRSPYTSGAFCLGVYPNKADSTTILGGIVMRNTLVTFDRGNSRIGFLKMNCNNKHILLNDIEPNALLTRGETMQGDHQNFPSSSDNAPNQVLHKEM